MKTDATQCPLCHRPNDCQLCTLTPHKGRCWCLSVSIPEALLARVPEALKNQACICLACVVDYQRQNVSPLAALPGEIYFDEGGRMVFTAAYHLRRGYCCDNGCRHCPYPPVK